MGRKGRETPSRGAERTLNQESGTLTSDWAVLLICCVTVGKSLALSGPEYLYSKNEVVGSDQKFFFLKNVFY